MQPSLTQPDTQHCAVTDLEYLEVGSADHAVVLLHGWAAFKELWWSTMVGLAPQYRVFAPDMPGHGQSPLLRDQGMVQIAERIASFIRARGLSSVTLVGHSMGGNVAAELALARPDLIQRLVLVDAATQGHALPAYTRSYLVDVFGFAALRLTLLLSQGAGVVGQYVPHDHGGGTLLPALRRLAYSARYDAAVMHRLLTSLVDNPLEQRVEALRMPTLVVSGALDPLVPAQFSRRLAQQIPSARYVEIRGAGHNPMDERPREFLAVLLRFLQEE